MAFPEATLFFPFIILLSVVNIHTVEENKILDTSVVFHFKVTINIFKYCLLLRNVRKILIMIYEKLQRN